MGFFDRLFRRKPKPDPEATSRPRPSEQADESELPEWAGFFGSAKRFERFDAAVRSHFRLSGRRALMIDGTLRVTNAPGGAPDPSAQERQFGLGNLAQTCALEPEESWPSIIEKHFNTTERLLSEKGATEPVSYEDAQERLGIRLWDMSVGQVRAMSIWREEVPGLASVLCLDEPEAIRSLRPDEVTEWGVSEDALFAAARSNLARLAEVHHAKHELPEGHTLHEFLGESPFSASWATAIDDLPIPDGPHGCFFAVPNRHRVMVMPFEGLNSISPLGQFMTIAHGLEIEGPGSISGRVYWRREGRMLDIPYEISAGALNVSPPDEFVEYLNALAESDRM